MIHSHSCFHVLSTRTDPTRTTQLRKRFEADFKRRFAKLIKAIIQVVEKDDAFGLEPKTNKTKFTFPTRAGKVAEFMEWLKKQQDILLFDGTLALPREAAINRAWMNTYIQTSYRRGLEKATVDIRKAGGKVDSGYVSAAFFRPVHADRAGKIYTRAYDGLKGITREMDTQLSGVLSQGIADGRNPRVIARNIVDRVSKIGLTRARLLARTEVIAAHAEAKLTTYEDAKIQGVGLQSEWLTAGDERVCAECEGAAERGPYETQAARGLIPLHPNCRCTWIPIITDGKEIELR